MRAEYIDTNANAADVLTKGLSTDAHQRHTDTLCGLDWDADQDLIYQQQLAPEQRSEYATDHFNQMNNLSQTDRDGGAVSGEQSEMNTQLNLKGNDVMSIGEEHTDKLSLVVKIKGVRESCTSMEELD